MFPLQVQDLSATYPLSKNRNVLAVPLQKTQYLAWLYPVDYINMTRIKGKIKTAITKRRNIETRKFYNSFNKVKWHCGYFGAKGE